MAASDLSKNSCLAAAPRVLATNVDTVHLPHQLPHHFSCPCAQMCTSIDRACSGRTINFCTWYNFDPFLCTVCSNISRVFLYLIIKIYDDLFHAFWNNFLFYFMWLNLLSITKVVYSNIPRVFWVKVLILRILRLLLVLLKHEVERLIERTNLGLGFAGLRNSIDLENQVGRASPKPM
jgi:hypothetical protein